MNLAALDLNLLLVLQALLEEGSVRAAAKRLALSPPAASRALGRLRQTLRDPLFVRTHEGMVPTERANALRSEVQSAVTALERVFGGPSAFEPGASERVFRLAMTDVLQVVLLPALAHALAQRAAKIRIVVEPSPHPERLAALAAGRLDVVVALAQAQPPTNVHELTLFRDRFVCMVGKRSRTRALSKARYASLHHVVVAPHGQPGSIADDALAAHRLQRHVALVVPHFATAARLVAESDLVATVPSSVVQLWPERVRALACPIALPELRFCAYTHRRSDDDAGVSWLLAQLRGR